MSAILWTLILVAVLYTPLWVSLWRQRKEQQRRAAEQVRQAAQPTPAPTRPTPEPRLPFIDDREWYVNQRCRGMGPFTSNEIRRDLLIGRIRFDDRVSLDGHTWEPVTQVPELIPEELLDIHAWQPEAQS